jgi:3'(2'), 5'-bisphosphate nucleotidase
LDTAARLLAAPDLAGPRRNKADRTPVTALDLAVQAVLAHVLQNAFPKDSLVAEESADVLDAADGDSFGVQALDLVRRIEPEANLDQVREWLNRGRGELARRFWTLDPVDGTKGLLRGGQFVTALALIEDGQVVLGGLACPRYPDGASGGSLALAVRGGGAWTAPTAAGPWRRLAVSGISDPAQGRLLRSVESPSTTNRSLGAIRRALQMKRPALRMDSQVKYLALAAGDGDLMIRLPRRRGRLHENIWDHAAGALLVEEAGGRCSDVLGRPLEFGIARQMIRNQGVVASNGRLHESTLAAMRSALPPEQLGREA